MTSVDLISECMTLGLSNRTICSPLSNFLSKKFPPFYHASHNNPILYTAERGRKERAEAENGKRDSLEKE